MPDAAALEIRGLTRSFVEPSGERRVVLRGLDLDLHTGSSAALLGRSGSGKSTLLNTIAGIEPIEAGSVRVDGIDVADLDERGRTRLRRQRLGLVFQFFHLFPMLTVHENVLLPLELAGRLDGEGRDRAAALLERVGLADRLHASPDVLSGGEQQRVAIARALVHGPRLVLADEPTGNLDEDAGDRALALLEEAVAGERGCALLMATHSRRAAERMHRVLRIESGRIVEGARDEAAPAGPAP